MHSTIKALLKARADALLAKDLLETEARTARPPKPKRQMCQCGECEKCKHRMYMAAWRHMRRTNPYGATEYELDVDRIMHDPDYCGPRPVPGTWWERLVYLAETSRQF